MGTWDAGIFEDDIAMDIKTEYEDAICEGISMKETTKQILESYRDILDDVDEGSIVYLALAALQIEQGTVLKKVKQTTLKIIDSGKGLDRWEEAGEELLKRRKCVLNDLKRKLMTIKET